MAQPSLLIQDLLNSTREEYFYHSRRVDQLKHKDYPFPWCIVLLDKLSDIDDAILRELEKLEKELMRTKKSKEQAPFMKEDLDKIQRYGQLVGIIHYVLTFFEIGCREYVPEGTAVSIKNIVRKFDKRAAFILVPIFEYNYIYLDLMTLLKKALHYALRARSDVDKLLSDMPDRYAVFGFPLIMKQNVILNSILAHEVGHFIDNSRNLSGKILQKVMIDRRKIDRLVKIMEKAKIGERKEIRLTYFISPGTLRAQITKLAAKQISEWLKELVADAIAFHLFGPVFLHSISNFLLALVKIDEASTDHPPPRMRIRLLLEAFNERGYPGIVKYLKEVDDKKTAENFVGLALELEEILRTIEPSAFTPFQELVIDSVQKVIPDLKKEVDSLMTTFEYKPRKFAKDVFQLSKRLDLIVPPAEIDVGKPAIPVSILNAGALYKTLLVKNLYKAFEATTALEKTEIRDKLHSLILKALELSDIEVRMKEVLKGEESS